MLFGDGAQSLSTTFSDFLRRYPKARLQVVAVDRPVDLISERIDVALRVRAALTTDAALTMRTLGMSSRILVAAPSLGEARGRGDVDALADLLTLATTDQMGGIVWEFKNAEGTVREIHHEPRMTCVDFTALRDAAAAGLGIALLPDHTCRTQLATGELIQVFPDWRTDEGIVHRVFTTRRGLPPAVRAFIDHLATAFRATGVLTNDIGT